MTRVLLVDTQVNDSLKPLYERLVSRGSSLGCNIRWHADLSFDDYSCSDVIVLQHPCDALGFPDRRILGARLLNRFERLCIAQDVGAPVAPFASPPTLDLARDLFDIWGAENIVFKADWSFRRKGVFLWKRGTDLVLHSTYAPGADIFMPTLLDDPATYKVDLFCGNVIACRRVPTPPIHDPRFHDDSAPSDLLETQDWAASFAEALGSMLLSFGTGYFGIDFMRVGTKYWIVEINSCGVGRMNTWVRWPAAYIDRYADVLHNWSCQIVTVPTISESLAACRRRFNPA